MMAVQPVIICRQGDSQSALWPVEVAAQVTLQFQSRCMRERYLQISSVTMKMASSSSTVVRLKADTCTPEVLLDANGKETRYTLCWDPAVE